MTIGQKIATLRKKAGLTQARLGLEFSEVIGKDWKKPHAGQFICLVEKDRQSLSKDEQTIIFNLLKPPPKTKKPIKNSDKVLVERAIIEMLLKEINEALGKKK